MGLNIGLHEDLNSTGIQQLWILKKSGICVLHLNFTGKETLIDESLIGGFFSVITTLISTAEDNLEEIRLNSTSIFHKNVNDLDFSIVLATNPGSKKNKNIIKRILNKLSSSFYDDFNYLALEKVNLLSNEIFYPFSTKVVKIINNKGKIKKERKEGRSFLNRVQTMVKAGS